MLSCLLGLTHCVPQQNRVLFPYSIMNPLLTKLVWSRLLDIQAILPAMITMRKSIHGFPLVLVGGPLGCWSSAINF